MLGLTHKGHLGPGADADVTIYTPNADIERMFELPRCVLKSGEIVIDQGEVRASFNGATHHVSPEYDDAAIPTIRDWFEAHYTIQFRNYPMQDEELLGKMITVPTTDP